MTEQTEQVQQLQQGRDDQNECDYHVKRGGHYYLAVSVGMVRFPDEILCEEKRVG